MVLALGVPVKIGIAVGVVVLVSALVAFLLYWFVFRHTTLPNHGADNFGTIAISDASSQAQAPQFATGDTLQLKYTPSVTGFSGRSVWSLSTDGGQSFPFQISNPSLGNAVQWTIPNSVFTQQAVFKVADAAAPNDYVTTSTVHPYTIEPTFALLTGPGVTQAGDSIFQDTAVTSVVAADTALLGLTEGGFLVQITTDPQFQSGVTTANLLSTHIDTDQQRITLVWSASDFVLNVYYRIVTTTLVNQGYPYELSAVAPQSISVIPNASCGSSPGTTDFTLCQLTLAEADTGRTNALTPGSAVKLYLAYHNTYPGTFVLSYTVNGGASQPWAATQLSASSADPVVFLATLPTLTTSQFQATIAVGGATLPSNVVALVSNFKLNVTAGTTFVALDRCNSISYALTTCTMSPPDYQPATWSVGFANPDGSNVNLYPDAVLSVSYHAGVATLKWCLNWNQLFFNSAAGQVNRRLVVSADHGAAQQSVPVVFNLQTYYPLFTVLSNNVQASFDGCNTAWIFDNYHSFTVGLWPDPAGSDAFYLSSAPGYQNKAVWLGPVKNDQSLAGIAPNAPQPVNYPSCVTSTGVASIPSGAALYTLSASPTTSGAVRIASAGTSPQTLYSGPFDTAHSTYGLYALNPSDTPTTTSDFLWPDQVFPF